MTVFLTVGQFQLSQLEPINEINQLIYCVMTSWQFKVSMLPELPTSISLSAVMQLVF
jgi:hypothetical protein